MIDKEDMLRQAQEFQKRMDAAERAMQDKVVTAESGGGMICLEGFANGQLSSVFIDPSLFAVESRHMAEDLLKAAFNMFQANVVEAARNISASILKDA